MQRWHRWLTVLAGPGLIGGTLVVGAAVTSAAVPAARALPAVQVLPAISAGARSGNPTGISCPTVSWCVAVGDLNEDAAAIPGGTSGGTTAPIAWIRSGRRWTAQVLPLPADSTKLPQVSMGPVSCPAVGTCVAIGTYNTSAKFNNLGIFVERLRSDHWRASAVAEPPNSFPAFEGGGQGPRGLSCATSTDCVAVGAVMTFSHAGIPTVPVVYRLRGARWTSRTLPAPSADRAHMAWLDSVSCASATRCVAVGEFSGRGGLQLPLVESLTGSSWTPTTSLRPSAANGGSTLSGVTCPTVHLCTAVGSTNPVSPSGRTVPVAETWRHGRWTSHVFPSTSPSGSQLSGVACAAPGRCTAVGSRGARSGTPLIEILGAGTWAARTPPGRGALGAVACPAVASCLATVSVGFNLGVDSLTAGQLAPIRLALPAGMPLAGLAGVSCPSVARCVAVGAYSSASGTHDLIETRAADGAWTPTTGVKVKGTYAGLQGVSCAPHARRASGCAAVGSQAVVVLRRGRWQGQLLAVPSGDRDVSLDAVSCPTATRCIAVGDVELERDGPDVPIIATLRGTRWTTTIPPAPKGALYTNLASISCPSATSCIAVGTWDASIGADQAGGLAERLSAGRWTVSSERVAFNSVDCPQTTTACTAVGESGFYGGVERLRGDTWRSTTVRRGVNTAPSAISCPTPSHCYATVTRSQGLGLSLLTITPSSVTTATQIQTPPGAADAGLSGLSCPAPAACTLVGGDDASDGAFALVATLRP